MVQAFCSVNYYKSQAVILCSIYHCRWHPQSSLPLPVSDNGKQQTAPLLGKRPDSKQNSLDKNLMKNPILALTLTIKTKSNPDSNPNPFSRQDIPRRGRPHLWKFFFQRGGFAPFPLRSIFLGSCKKTH